MFNKKKHLLENIFSFFFQYGKLSYNTNCAELKRVDPNWKEIGKAEKVELPAPCEMMWVKNDTSLSDEPVCIVVQSCLRIHYFSIRDFSYPRFTAARKTYEN
jgi:hypothetical protein